MAKDRDSQDAARRRLARANYREAKDALVAARKRRRARILELRKECRARQEQERARAQDARNVLLASQRAERDALRVELRDARRVLAGSCSADRSASASLVRDAERRLAERKADLLWYSKTKSTAPRGMSAAERVEHERDEARNNLGSREEELLFDHLVNRRQPRIKSSARRSLTEAFYEYVHDHPEALAELVHAVEVAELRRLESEERAAWKEAQRRRPRVALPSSRGAVVASADFGEWGG